MKKTLKLTELGKREMSRIFGGAPYDPCDDTCTCPCTSGTEGGPNTYAYTSNQNSITHKRYADNGSHSNKD